MSNSKDAYSLELEKIRDEAKRYRDRFNSVNTFLKNIGLDIDRNGSVCPNTYVETPTRVYKAMIKRGHIGAFSYIGRDVFIYDTTIKRYCSIAKSVNIGHGNHPTTWLSTNPFMYEQSFRISTGVLFPYHEDYTSYVVPNKNRQQLKKDVDVPPHTVIGNDVWIGVGVLILPNVTIGDGAIIGAGSVVTKNIPPYAIAVGNPAKIIKYRFNEKQILELLKLKWWEYSPWDLHKAHIEFYNIEKAIEQLKKLRDKGTIERYTYKEFKVSDLLQIYKEVVE